ncbi:MAG: T9SS type A sorting domain-containing protein [Bacteroidales bacterium]|nr:T9SS type A sorting domain-containing protein [Bacteroidales bacterium]
MKTEKILIFVLLFVAISVNAQKIPQKKLNDFFKEAYEKINENKNIPQNINGAPTSNELQTAAFQNINKFRNIKPLKKNNTRSDTLFVGIPPTDSLIVTGNFFHDGPIFVYDKGILRFKNANATILGDLWVWGDSALVTADSSTLYFPQQYFYQRSLIIAGKGKVIYRNTTLDHSGLSHNLLLTDSAKMEMHNVTNVGFTTCGTYLNPELYIDGINEAGEFIITDKAKLTFKNAHTILLWHHFPKTSVVNYSFPKGDTVYSYVFNNTTPGISGIDYDVDVDTSYAVMWGMMPTTGSDITISNSKIRSIGLWFEGNDSLDVNGLVDNSTYANFVANLSDRNMHLINSSVQTWSLYPMDSTKLNVTGCILGEIGTEHHSQLQSSNIFVDGSGGYWWSTDTTFMLAGYSTAVNAIRSSRNSIFLFAYSTLNSGVASSLDNSILMVIQSQLPEEPQLFDASCVWFEYIGKPSSSFVDTIIPIHGSAWIDKTPVSLLMDFNYYSLYYQKPGDATWYAIAEKVKTEKRDEVLANWDTHGFTPGAYILKLILCDNTVDSNKAEAVKSINLLPGILSVNEKNTNTFNCEIIPNPINDRAEVSFYLNEKTDMNLLIVDALGKIVIEKTYGLDKGNSVIEIDSSNLSKGLYYCILKSGSFCEVKKIVKE